MTSVPGVDHPVEQTEAEVTLIGRGISVSSRVEVVQNEFISVRPSVGEFVEQVVVKVGDVVEIFWKTEDAQRAMPAEVTDVEQGAIIRWRMRATGPAEASQRRKAVRGRVNVPVTAEYGSDRPQGRDHRPQRGRAARRVRGHGRAARGRARSSSCPSSSRTAASRQPPRSCAPRPGAPAGSSRSASSTCRNATRTTSGAGSSRRCARSGRRGPTTRRRACAARSRG